MSDPRLFSVSLGVPYARTFVQGFLDRFHHGNPADTARATVITNSGSMARAIMGAFAEHTPILAPKVLPITQIERLIPDHAIGPSIDPLRLRLELAQLTARRLEADPDLAQGSTAFDLSGSLLRLLGEMASEGVLVETLAALDLAEHSQHWQRNLGFIGLVDGFLKSGTALEPEARQRAIVMSLIDRWQTHPPPNRIIIAGSTGSRGTTRQLIEAVARLDNGYVVFPGVDHSMSGGLWAKLGEDHPQHRFAALLQALNLNAEEVTPWVGASTTKARQKVLSLALRPPPVTDQWVREGPNLPTLTDALQSITLLEAPGQQAEAQAIALGIRAAVEDEKTVALVSPDRTLTRRVSAALDRWGIIADDSAGRPLALSAPGRLLLQVSTLNRLDLPSSEVLALLKHPLVATGSGRGTHLLMTRELELWARRQRQPFLSDKALAKWAGSSEDRRTWVAWVLSALPEAWVEDTLPLGTAIQRLLAAAERLASGPGDTGSGALWEEDAGILARAKIDALSQVADASAAVGSRDFLSILKHILQDEVRNPLVPHEDVVIIGTLEARGVDADLVILAGLNEKVWPPAEDHDPWLNRALRRRAGLLSPDRRTGLSAHDFEQAFGAPEIWLSRTLRTDDGETVPSRWINRLLNLVTGLPDQGGPDVVRAMRKRGDAWLQMAQKIDRRGERLPPAPRPAPAPPVAARPTRLSVTEIQRLIRDPFEIYAKHVLKLAPAPQTPVLPDARLRGIALHEVADRFTSAPLSGDPETDRDRLLKIAKDVFADLVPWPVTRHLWLARLARIADTFLKEEEQRQTQGRIFVREVKAELILKAPPFTLVGKVDRIDHLTDGTASIFDYKSGKPPSPDQIRYYDRQLLLEAVMVAHGAFGDGLVPARVGYIGLGAEAAAKVYDLDGSKPLSADTETVYCDLGQLIAAYQDPSLGYASRRIIEKTSYVGDFDHLARYGEWDESVSPTTAQVGP